MKKSILLSSLTFIIGLSCGYAFWHSAPEKVDPTNAEPVQVSEKQEVPSHTDDQLEEIASLKEQIRQMKLASSQSQNQEAPSPEEVRKHMKMSIIEGIIYGEKTSPGQAELDRKNFMRNVRGLNLTPEQMVIAERLWEKRMQQMRLIVQTQGLLTENEKKEQFPDLYHFSFDSELKKILADEQSDGYEEKKHQEMAGVGNMFSAKFISDYGISTDSGFSAEDQTSIQEAVTKAWSQNIGKLEVPEPIKDLNLGPMDERVLASCYKNLPQELFEKVYQQMLNKETVAP